MTTLGVGQVLVRENSSCADRPMCRVHDGPVPPGGFHAVPDQEWSGQTLRKGRKGRLQRLDHGQDGHGISRDHPDNLRLAGGGSNSLLRVLRSNQRQDALHPAL